MKPGDRSSLSITAHSNGGTCYLSNEIPPSVPFAILTFLIPFVRHYGQLRTFQVASTLAHYLSSDARNTPSRSLHMTNGEQIAARMQQVLSGRGLTLSDVSRESRLRYPADRGYWIPHNFYARLRAADFSPRMEHILALSTISKYRLVDWLILFGFHLDDLSGLAAALPTKRTLLLDSVVYDVETPIRWFRSKASPEGLAANAPLGHFVELGPLRPLNSLLQRRPSPFLYAKVGRNDAFAFPDLLPGSILRIDGRKRSLGAATSRAFFLVEHTKGLTCCRLHATGRNLITLRSTELPYAQVALQLGREASVLGKVDLEFRFLTDAPSPVVAPDLAVFWDPQPLSPPSATSGFAEFAKRARERAGLSLREASARSRLVAEALGDRRYFCARATLSAYETNGKPPRQVHKLLGLCALYSLTFSDAFAGAIGKTEGLGQDPIPPVVLGRKFVLPRNNRAPRPDELASDFLSGLLKDVEEIPFFLRNSIGPLAGLTDMSVRDIVWLGGHRLSLHPYLNGSLLAVVNRRQRTPPSMGKTRLWEEPLYLLLRRDGSYLCARCTLHDKALVIHPFADGFDEPVRLRNGVDAEIVGRVAAIVRRL